MREGFEPSQVLVLFGALLAITVCYAHDAMADDPVVLTPTKLYDLIEEQSKRIAHGDELAAKRADLTMKGLLEANKRIQALEAENRKQRESIVLIERWARSRSNLQHEERLKALETRTGNMSEGLGKVAIRTAELERKASGKGGDGGMQAAITRLHARLEALEKKFYVTPTNQPGGGGAAGFKLIPPPEPK